MEIKERTIFLVISNGFSIRYLLRTDLLKTLKESGVRIVILFGDAQNPDFYRDFSDRNILIEKLQSEKYCEFEKLHKRILTVFKRIRRFTLNAKFDIGTVDRFFEIEIKKIKTIKERIYYFFIKVIIMLMRRFRLLRRLWVWVESGLFQPRFHKELFLKYKPEIVVVTSLGYFNYDYYIMREAKQHKAKIVSVILSWDNTSSKGIGGARADHVITWHDNMKREVIESHDYHPSRVSIGGVSHFDIYRHPENFMPRVEFLNKFGLKSEQKIIFFATKSPSAYPWNPDIVEILAKAIADNEFVFPCQLLVRFHPIYFIKKHAVLHEKNSLQEKNINKFKELKEKYPEVNIVYSYPEFNIKTSFDIKPSAFTDVASMLKHCDVLVNLFSTLNLEGSIMDIPLVNISFNGMGVSPTGDPRHNILIDELQFHNQRVVKSGAIKIARTPDELISHINMYLKNRALDRDKREKLCEQECGPYLGEAGKKVASILIELLDGEYQKINKRDEGL